MQAHASHSHISRSSAVMHVRTHRHAASPLLIVHLARAMPLAFRMRANRTVSNVHKYIYIYIYVSPILASEK